MRYLTRDVWGARAPREAPVSLNPEDVTTTRIVHAGTGQDPVALQAQQMDLDGLNDAAYSFLVDGKGTMFIVRGWFVRVGDTESHVIGWMGSRKTKAQQEALHFLANEIEIRLGRPLILDGLS